PAAAPHPDAGGDDVVVLDVRGLEPPEPMMRTLETLETLPPARHAGPDQLPRAAVPAAAAGCPRLHGRGARGDARRRPGLHPPEGGCVNPGAHALDRQINDNEEGSVSENTTRELDVR